MKAMTLGCRCGAVELEVSGQPMVQFYCHCDGCQAVHGARDGLPHYRSRPARFGGSDETLDWE
jgi:hypothetical protein